MNQPPPFSNLDDSSLEESTPAMESGEVPRLDSLETTLDLLRNEQSTLPPLRAARDLFERTYLSEVMRRTSGNVTRASRIAGRNRTDFYELLRRHQLTVSDFKG